MGINCCSHSNEAPEITITKPEKNMTSTSQNPIAQNQNKEKKKNQEYFQQ